MSLLKILEDKPEDVSSPNEDVRLHALKNLKQALDSVAPKYSPLDAVYIDGLKADQVWVQAQMVLDGVAERLSSTISKYTPSNEAGNEAGNEDSEELSDDVSNEEDFSGSDDAELEADSENDAGHLDEEEEEESEEEENENGNKLDLSNFHDDYEASDENEENEVPQKLSQTRDELEGSDRDEQFDLAEFQQHVLRLEQDESEDDGPEIDFNADIEDSSDEDDGDLHYSDFFGPAPKKSQSSKSQSKSSTETKPKKKVQFKDNDDDDDLWSDVEGNREHENGEEDADEDQNEEDIMALTRKDLFNDEDEDEGSENASSEQLSTFEKQQLEIARQIEELEAENMGPKDWGMRGEAKAKDRPEESSFNIEFDRNSKPAPIITEESTSTLEDSIKTRIKKQQFDDIPRRSELNAPDLKKESPESSELKSQKSLAELYEEDRMRSENPEYFSKQDSAAMDAAHQEIVNSYQSVANKLDALCSWAYTPRKPAPSISVVTQGPAISMEEAQPGTLAPDSQLAPQEVYKSESATPMDNSEMTTSMKRKRRRDKSLQKGAKVQDVTQPAGKRSKRDKKEDMFSTLKRGNVTMVDRKGNKSDMRGNEVTNNTPQTASHMKL